MSQFLAPFPSTRSFLRWALCLLPIILLGALPASSKADLFYKVQKAINLTDPQLNPAADGTVPISVTGLNDSGAFIGYFPSATANKPHAFLWDSTHQNFVDLNNLLAADSSLATCLNNNGTVAGVFWELGTYAEKGFIYQPDGTINTFISPDGAGGNITAVSAINTAGDLVGTYVAVDGTTRGFIVQQGNGSPTITDLGDLGQTGYSQYIWPSALNDLDQVVGNEYLVPTGGQGTSYTQGFFWDAGMTLIDASDLSANWTAVALNNNGQAVGLYGMSATPSTPFTVTGSYYWDPNIGDVDLGSLGGGAGASVFALTDSSVALGTSLSSDGTLHLFNSDMGALTTPRTDMGSVSLYSGDTSFSPLSLNSIVVKGKPTTVGGNKTIYNIAGFGTDAYGDTLSLLWMNNSINSVANLVPYYLSFTTISHAYGSMVLINGSEQIACAGTDNSGKQMALLLSVDPDTDNDGLPDSWEMQYYGHLGVDKYAPAAGGGGYSNWLAYELGTDPNDFYNGQVPQLYIVGGGNQRANAGTLLPQPISVEVNYYGTQNAPLTFVASGGALLAPDASGNYQPSATINVRSNGQISINGWQTYVGQVYVYLPTATSTVSTITATATSGNKSTSLSTTAVASDPNTAPPTDLAVQSNSDTYTTLSFTPSDTTLPVSIEVSLDGGKSWTTWGVADPGDTTITLYGLPQDTQLMIRAFTGIDSSSMSGQSGTNSVQTNGTPTPTPTSAPTASIQSVQQSQPILLGDQTQFIGYNTGFQGFQQQASYLSFTDVITDKSQDGTSTTFTITSTVTPGNRVVSTTYNGDGGTDWGTAWQIGSDTSEQRDGTGNPDGEVQTSHAAVTLANPYSLNQFLNDSLTWWNGYSGIYYQGANQALNLVFVDPEVQEAGAISDHSRYIDKLHYYWHVNKDPNGHVVFDEVFTPKDGSAIKHHIQQWDTKGATESPVYTLDPTASTTNNQAEGTYRVFSVELHPDGRADSLAYSGDVVPSNKTDGTGQKHFVTPQTPSGYATIEARVQGMDDGGNYFNNSNFSKLYKFAVFLNNSDVTAQASFSNNNVLYLKTDTANKYIVQLLTNDGSNTIISNINVWVVWATVVPTKVSGPTVANGAPTTPSGATGSGTLIQSVWSFVATIAPASITTSTDDIPDLTGKPSSLVPNANAAHFLDGGAFGQPSYKWDISRRIRVRVLSPTLGTNDYNTIKGIVYKNLPNPNKIVAATPNPGPDSYPASNVEGNDDSGDGQETDNPYKAPNIGKLTDKDTPRIPNVLNKAGPVNTVTEFRYNFEEFVRLEIAGQWYLVSDPTTGMYQLDSKLHKIWVQATDDLDGDGQPSAIAGGFFEGHYDNNASVSDATNSIW